MAGSDHISPGMTITLEGQLFRVESAIKVKVAKGNPFIKTKLRNLVDDEIVERNFKTTQKVEEVSVSESTLEYLYLEDKKYLFLDIGSLEMVLVPANVIADRMQYLKEGIQVTATFYGDTVFSVELPLFLELMVAQTEKVDEAALPVSNVTKTAVLETGARVEVPTFVESGDIIKVDTQSGEFIQRV